MRILSKHEKVRKCALKIFTRNYIEDVKIAFNAKNSPRYSFEAYVLK